MTDSDMSRHMNQNPTTIGHYNTISNAAVGALIGGAGGMWLLSYRTHNQHWRETGFLAGAAALNSFVVVEAMKYPLGRERPFQGDGSGQFFQHGVSFPSEHSAAAWAVAGVIAHEYPGPLTKIAVVQPGYVGGLFAVSRTSAFSVGCVYRQPDWQSRRAGYLHTPSRFTTWVVNRGNTSAPT